MAITSEQKKLAIEKFSLLLKENKNLIAWKYHGINSKEMSSLREKFNSQNSKNLVCKNRLAKISLEKKKMNEANEYLKGPNSFIFTNDESFESIKFIHEYIKKNNLEYSFAYVDGQFKTAEEIFEILNLPSKQELLQKLAFLLKNVIGKFAISINEVAKKSS